MRASKIAIAGVLVLFGACAQTEPPAPNKNTNWLRECATDADCGDALSCLCGVCSERCTADDACTAGEAMATCRHEQSDELIGQCGDTARWSSICIAACEDDADCGDVGEGAHCEHGACIASTNPYLERASLSPQVDGGTGDAPCVAYGDGCAPLVATGLDWPSGLAVRGERAYWLSFGNYGPEGEVLRHGSLRSARVSGADHVTLASGLVAPSALALDATHAYFVVADFESEPPHSQLVRIPLGGGELEVVSENRDYFFDAIVLDDANVYCAGFDNRQEDSALGPVRSLYRVPKVGRSPQAAPDIVAGELLGRPMEIAMSGRHVLWKNGEQIRWLDVDRPEHDEVLVDSEITDAYLHPYIAVAGTEIVWFSRGEECEIGRLDITKPAELTKSFYSERGLPADGIAADEQHVWWSIQVGGPRRFARTDKATGETVTIADSEALYHTFVALSDDYVLVASANTNGTSDTPGFVVRFPRGD